MEDEESSNVIVQVEKLHDLGTFEGFNFRSQSAIEKVLNAEAVVSWDHDGDGEAEFWPSGENSYVALLFHDRSSVTAGELLALNQLLDDLGGDSDENFLKIHFAMSKCGRSVQELDASTVEDEPLHIFFGKYFFELRKDAAYELFELYYPEAYQTWEKSNCDGLIFDVDRFLDSPSFYVEEVKLGEGVALLISPQ